MSATFSLRPGWLTPDAFAMFNMGEQANEYLLPYVTARFTDPSQSPEKAEWWWGMVRVDLATGNVNWANAYPEFAYLSLDGIAAGIALATGETDTEAVLVGLAS